MSSDGFIRISNTPSGKAALTEFLNSLKVGRESFRYFLNRPIDVIQTHETTLLLRVSDKIVAYGHLEQEDDKLWLGIAVGDAFVGQGWGKVMMDELISEAASRKFQAIFLRVDIDNLAGIRLYQKMGFHIVEEEDVTGSLLMNRPITTDDLSNNE